jgi:hypothetical protein
MVPASPRDALMPGSGSAWLAILSARKAKKACLEQKRMFTWNGNNACLKRKESLSETENNDCLKVELWHSIPRVAFLGFTKTNKSSKEKLD